MIKSFHFRAANGSGVATPTRELAALHTNTYHFGKEVIFSRMQSYTIPKGSPLQVGKSTASFCKLVLKED